MASDRAEFQQLRHVAANTYTVTPRLDLLTGDERRRLHDTARWNQPLDVDQANVLLAALVLHNNEYAGGYARPARRRAYPARCGGQVAGGRPGRQGHRPILAAR
jgi:hypothetical protein